MKVINIDWKGTYTLDEVIEGFDSEKDHGVYQIYGNHILNGYTLLYVGQASDFSRRLAEHRSWLKGEDNINIYLGWINSESWKEDADIAEKILLYKYSPNYNGREIALEPKVEAKLIHRGCRGMIHEEDNTSNLFG